jgi:hypothetical protein
MPNQHLETAITVLVLNYLTFSPSIFFLLYIQTFFYTDMNIFITLLENVNKSRTSANNLSLTNSLSLQRFDAPT